jgi:hypothetical protein
LRKARGGKLLINTMLKAKLIKKGISALSPIVIVNDFQAVGMLIVQSQSEAPKVLKHFILALQEENPKITRITSMMTRMYHLPPMERTREGPIVSIWSNCSGCLVFTVDDTSIFTRTRGH